MNLRASLLAEKDEYDSPGLDERAGRVRIVIRDTSRVPNIGPEVAGLLMDLADLKATAGEICARIEGRIKRTKGRGSNWDIGRRSASERPRGRR